MRPETWLLLVATLGGVVFVLTRVVTPHLAGLPFGLAGRSLFSVAAMNALGTIAAGAFLGWVTEPTWGIVAAGASGGLGIARLAHQLRVPRRLARALAHPHADGELVRVAEQSRPQGERRGSTAGQTWALWVLGTVEALQDAGVWKDEKSLLAMLDDYPLNPVLSSLHRTMAAYYLLRSGDHEKARWALSMDLNGASEGLRARVEALSALLAAVEGDVRAAGKILDHWMRPEAWSKRIREMARVNVLAAEDDAAAERALDHIELRWGESGKEELRQLGGPAAEWLDDP